jgi:hypothetical protein
MQSVILNKRQSVELCDNIGQMLTAELDIANIQNKAKRIVTDYIKTNNLNENADNLMKKISWSVKVEIR